jgi:hypothetical protein
MEILDSTVIGACESSSYIPVFDSYSIRRSDGLQKARQQFLRLLQTRIDMISLTLLMLSFLLLDSNERSWVARKV